MATNGLGEIAERWPRNMFRLCGADDPLVEDLVASPCDVERLLKLHRIAALAEVVAQMVEWGDADAFLDTDGRLRVPDRPSGNYARTSVLGSDLFIDNIGAVARVMAELPQAQRMLANALGSRHVAA